MSESIKVCDCHPLCDSWKQTSWVTVSDRWPILINLSTVGFMFTYTLLSEATNCPPTLHMDAGMLLIYQELMGFFAGPRCWGEAGPCERRVRQGLGFAIIHSISRWSSLFPCFYLKTTLKKTYLFYLMYIYVLSDHASHMHAVPGEATRGRCISGNWNYIT